MEFLYELIVIILMLLLNAMFAGYEMSLAAISRSKLAVLSSQKKRGADDALFMKDRIESSLAVIQIGITLVGVIAASTGGAGVTESFVPYLQKLFPISDSIAEVVALICLVIPLSVFTIIFAELIPKVFALNNEELVCLKLSPVIKTIYHVFEPVVWLFEFVVKGVMGLLKQTKATQAEGKGGLHELKAAVTLARTSKLIGAQEEKIVLAAAQLTTRRIKDIMIAATDISMIPSTIPLMEALVRAHLDMHTRFPVCSVENDPQTIHGYIIFKDIVNALKMSPDDPSLKGITRPIQSYSSNDTISSVLGRMIHEKSHIAMIVDTIDKKIVGMVALEDIIEELVGDIEDESDRLPGHIYPYGNQWLMGGAVPMRQVASFLGCEDNFEGTLVMDMTLAEWAVHVLGKTLTGGEVFDSDGIAVTVRKIRRRKLAEAVVGKKI